MKWTMSAQHTASSSTSRSARASTIPWLRMMLSARAGKRMAGWTYLSGAGSPAAATRTSCPRSRRPLAKRWALMVVPLFPESY